MLHYGYHGRGELKWSLYKHGAHTLFIDKIIFNHFLAVGYIGVYISMALSSHYSECVNQQMIIVLCLYAVDKQHH